MNDAIESIAEPAPAEHPPGEYAIVELFGHTTLVGRIQEVERFGTKMLAIEVLFKGQLLPMVFYGGGSIYGLTPCSAEVAYARAGRELYHLPIALRSIVPPTALPAPEAERGTLPIDDDDDGRLF